MKKIEIYTSSTCKYCHMAMDFFRENNITFTEHNITEDPEAKKFLVSKGYRGVPVIIIDGKEILGFEEEELRKELEL